MKRLLNSDIFLDFFNYLFKDFSNDPIIIHFMFIYLKSTKFPIFKPEVVYGKHLDIFNE